MSELNLENYNLNVGDVRKMKLNKWYEIFVLNYNNLKSLEKKPKYYNDENYDFVWKIKLSDKKTMKFDIFHEKSGESFKDWSFFVEYDDYYVAEIDDNGNVIQNLPFFGSQYFKINNKLLSPDKKLFIKEQFIILKPILHRILKR